jgi:DGQHR domain-containing protein
MSFPFIQLEQPAGTFYLTAMPAEEIIRIARANPRIFNPDTLTSEGGVQREPSRKRVKGIAEYASSSDAAFPTAVLLAIHSEDCLLQDGLISVDRDGVADIVDGQHRILGLKEISPTPDFILPVIFILDATQEEKALLFATVNGTQTKVPASLIYDLYGVAESRSLNSMPESPWHRRLKMLGRKSVAGSPETLSQGTFIKFLLPNITANPAKDADLLRNGKKPDSYPQCVFNEYFRDEKDSLILKVLLNIFSGARAVWPVEWKDPDNFVLTKTLGFSGIMRALPELVRRGRERGELSQTYFQGVFTAARERMQAANKTLASGQFSASASGEAEFRDFILGATHPA